jgi:redox-sensitive bicupin YhaK (pirin superfamily)
MISRKLLLLLKLASYNSVRQWMTAGRGIMHAEMPAPYTHGLQLWVNLPRPHKMVEPAYQELLDKDIPRAAEGGVTVKVIAGESMGIKV